MSVLFPKVPKPRGWDYRPIYYDKDKEARKDRRLARLHRGAFREEHEKNMSAYRQRKKSKLLLWITLFAMLVYVFYYFL